MHPRRGFALHARRLAADHEREARAGRPARPGRRGDRCRPRVSAPRRRPQAARPVRRQPQTSRYDEFDRAIALRAASTPLPRRLDRGVMRGASRRRSTPIAARAARDSAASGLGDHRFSISPTPPRATERDRHDDGACQRPRGVVGFDVMSEPRTRAALEAAIGPRREPRATAPIERRRRPPAAHAAPSALRRQRALRALLDLDGRRRRVMRPSRTPALVRGAVADERARRRRRALRPSAPAGSSTPRAGGPMLDVAGAPPGAAGDHAARRTRTRCDFALLGPRRGRSTASRPRASPPTARSRPAAVVGARRGAHRPSCCCARRSARERGAVERRAHDRRPAASQRSSRAPTPSSAALRLRRIPTIARAAARGQRLRRGALPPLPRPRWTTTSGVHRLRGRGACIAWTADRASCSVLARAAAADASAERADLDAAWHGPCWTCRPRSRRPTAEASAGPLPDGARRARRMVQVFQNLLVNAIRVRARPAPAHHRRRAAARRTAGGRSRCRRRPRLGGPRTRERASELLARPGLRRTSRATASACSPAGASPSATAARPGVDGELDPATRWSRRFHRRGRRRPGPSRAHPRCSASCADEARALRRRRGSRRRR